MNMQANDRANGYGNDQMLRWRRSPLVKSFLATAEESRRTNQILDGGPQRAIWPALAGGNDGNSFA